MIEIGMNFVYLDETYTVTKLLGQGKGGYSYLGKSSYKSVVYKQMHYEPCDTYAFESNKLQSELRDYQRLANVGITMPKLLFYDDEKQYLIKEYIDGPTIAEIVAQNKLKDEYVIQMFKMCDLLYKDNLNIDYFPTNFVVSGNMVYYIDFECNTYMEEWDFKHWGIYFWANTGGWTKFMETGDHGYLSENAKPHKEGLDSEVTRLMGLGKICYTRQLSNI